MTREEAIVLFEKQLTAAQAVLDSGFGSNPGENDSLYRRRKEMAEVALTALRPVSREQEPEAENTELKERIINWRKYMAPTREQVEKVWRGEWNYSHTTETDHFAVVKCSKCGYKAFAMALYVKDGNFCPACGAPMTDEAVEMVKERMEALKDAVLRFEQI